MRSEIGPGWFDSASCREYKTEIFFPSDKAGVAEAKKICKLCPVIEPCLEFALSKREDHGVLGGTSERERRKILQRRRFKLLNTGNK